MSGWIYGVYHEQAPPQGADLRRVKIGCSKHDPCRDSLDGRVRKLDLAVVALGFGPVSHAFEPFQVSDHKLFERKLKDELDNRKRRAHTQGKRQLTEIFDVSLAELNQMVSDLKSKIGE
jgi:hypothetical protein